METEQYRAVTQYTGHPRLGDWESATRRPMTLEEAGRFVATKMAHIARRGDTALGEFTGIRIEPLHVGYEWDGRLSCCQKTEIAEQIEKGYR